MIELQQLLKIIFAQLMFLIAERRVGIRVKKEKKRKRLQVWNRFKFREKKRRGKELFHAR
jgi:hypothetical protein